MDDDAAPLDSAAWLERWDVQQGAGLADREARFQAMFDVVHAVAGAGPMTVLDVGSGPGSLAVRLLARFPEACVVAVDVDPVLLALGRNAYRGVRGLRFASADLRDPGWAGGLGLDGPVDAALSTTALHWLRRGEIERLYRDLAGLLRPGGVFLDGDHRQFGADEERLEQAARAVAEGERRRRGGPDGAATAESWEGWWDAVRAEPALAAAVAARDRLGHQHPDDRHDLRDEDHLRLLRQSGFAEAGTVWQLGDDRVLAAIR